jgi:hypothetical protein
LHARSWSSEQVTVIGASLLAVLLVVAWLSVWMRHQTRRNSKGAGSTAGERNVRNRKAQRAQSRRDRRKRR